MDVIQYAPFTSALDSGFWYQLSRKKVDVLKLDDRPLQIVGHYTNTDADGLPARLSVDYTAFNSTPTVPRQSFLVYGSIMNKNTVEEFKMADKTMLLEVEGKRIWEAIDSGEAFHRPSLLSTFFILTFSDLKKYHFYYWFCFPALSYPLSVTHSQKVQKITDIFTDSEIHDFLSKWDSFSSSTGNAYFVLERNSDSLKIYQLSEWQELVTHGGELWVGFSDPCTLPANPGWPLRNLLALLAKHSTEDPAKINVLCLRDRYRDGIRSVSHSLVLHVHLSGTHVSPRYVGWEKNERGRMGPRMVDLAASMDPIKLSESSVDLNLKLMRWRLLPELDLDKLSSTKCLLLGSGTLGCNVARNLMAWGIRHITLVDNSNVSYSNPVRQSLFTFEDAINGGKPKAETAAVALKKIFPGVVSRGVNLSIPMPGHFTGDSVKEQVRSDFHELVNLVRESDVIFLLTDTRESRWLPTLLGAAEGKIVLNAALGFDTFLVLRHGVVTSDSYNLPDPPIGIPLSGSQIGCYFCNDIIAPGDSTHDRTLDQQCTVTRPGVSNIAAALVVELMVSLLQHPCRGEASAETLDCWVSSSEGSPLGLVPHSIRGFLARMEQVIPATKRFNKCVACSQKVVMEYQEKGFDFILSVLNNPNYLEEMTGLTELHQSSHDTDIWALSDSEDIE